MAEIPTSEECLRKQVLRQLLYRRYDKGVDLANIFALQLELFRVGDETTKDTWQACKPFYLDYVGMTEKELQSTFLNAPPAPCTPLSQPDSRPLGQQYRGGKGAHPETICPLGTNMQDGFVNHESTGEVNNVHTQVPEDIGVDGSVQILPQQMPRPTQNSGVILAVQDTDHGQVEKNSSDFGGQLTTIPEFVIDSTSIPNVEVMGKVSSLVDVVQVYNADARPLAEMRGVGSWRDEALFVCRLACNMLKHESAQAEGFLSAEDARIKALQRLGSSMEVSLDSRRYAMRSVSPLRLQVL
jgi:hypothetical protein